ncbi:MAG: aldo/keto reductase [Pseudomonadota bacterium]
MNYRHVGKAGIQVSELSLGSWLTFRGGSAVDQSAKLMTAAYDAGVNFFDNAENYAGGESEEVMGAALKKLGWHRGSYLISTKLYWGLHAGPNMQNTLNRKYLSEAIDGSLRRLDMEYVDLLFCHRPDPTTPIEETVWAMHNIIERGKALYWGTSEWEPGDIVAAIDIAERHHLHKPVVEQPCYNLFERGRMSADYASVYEDHGYGSTTWSPLALGMLTGKYQDGIPRGSRGDKEAFDWLKDKLTDKQRIAIVAGLSPLARDMGASLAQFSIAWCLQNPWVSTVITGASSVEQVRENMQSIEFAARFTPELLAEIDKLFS